MLVNTLTDKKTIIAAFIFLKALKISLGKKEILLSNTNLSIINNIFYLSLKIFFRKKKVAEYFSNLNKKKLQQWKSKLDFLFKNLTFLKQNVNHYLIINLNKKIKFFIVKDLLKSFKKFKQNLFARRNDLFSDFLNTSCLLILKKLTANTYILILGQIFTLLLKKKHGSFFFFKNII